MHAGTLRHRVAIQQVTETRGATYRDVQRVWTTLATVWAAVEPLSGREFFSNREMQSELEVRIRIRHRDGLTPKMRVQHGTRLYEIQSVIDVGGRGIELHLMCSEFRSD